MHVTCQKGRTVNCAAKNGKLPEEEGAEAWVLAEVAEGARWEVLGREQLQALLAPLLAPAPE